MISQVEKKLISLIDDDIIKEFETSDFIKKNSDLANILGLEEKETPKFMKIIDEFAEYHQENIKLFITGKNNEPKNSKVDHIFSISNVFFDCLQKEENMDMKMIIFDVLFRMNSQKLFFFENISNLVILTEESDCLLFENIKNLFIKLNYDVVKFKNSSIKDSSMKSSILEFKKCFNELLSMFQDMIKIDVKSQKIDDEYVNLFKGNGYLGNIKSYFRRK